MNDFPRFDLQGQVALVTGAARGLGRAISLALAHAGADVALGFRDVSSGGELVREIEGLGRRALPLQVDISNMEQIFSGVNETTSRLGKLDILVNNAGIAPENLAENVREQDFDATLAVNLKGTFFVSQAAGRVMIRQKHGRIINMSSQAGFAALPGESVYCMTKAAIAHLTKCLAVEWGKHGITGNAVAPTFIRTPGTEEYLSVLQNRAAELERLAALHRVGVRGISRFDASEISVQIAGEVADFDELAWVDRRERKHVSRVLPLAIAAATEALSEAGVETSSLPLEQKRRFAVILGSGGGSQEFTEEQYRLFFHQQYKSMSLFCVPTGVMGTLSSELSVRFGLRGPSHVVTTGCTSSTDALGYAMRQIQSGRLDMVLSGGADAPIALGIVKGFLLMKILTDSWNHAPERASRPFSVARAGFVLAEGAWMLVLEEYEHAWARGAKILGEICGYW